MRLFMILVLLFAAGCGTKDKPTGAPRTDPNQATTQTNTVKEQEKAITSTEKLALEFTDLFFNSFDVEKRKAFIDQHIHPNSKELFNFIAVSEANTGKSGWELKTENGKITNPKLGGSVKEKVEGKDQEFVLIKGEDHELIIMFADGKVVAPLTSEATDENIKNMYKNARAKFK